MSVILLSCECFLIQEAPEFLSAEDGRIRPSDMGAPDDFSQVDKIRFGESIERPPDLSAFGIGRKSQSQSGGNKSSHPLGQVPVDPEKQKKEAATAGAKFLERQRLREEREKFLAAETAKSRDLGVSSLSSTLSLKDLVNARQSAQEAYAALKQKRLNENEKRFNRK